MNSLIWPVSRDQAQEILDFFCEYCLPSFGRFQDTMTYETQHGGEFVSLATQLRPQC